MVSKNIEALFKAAETGHHKQFEEIISKSHKSIITKLDPDNNNIIHIATQNNRGSIIASFENFIKENPAIEFNINDMNKFGQTPLDIAGQHQENTPGATIVKALESLSRALGEPLYTSESLMILRNMQIDDFIHSEYEIKKLSKSDAKTKDIEKIF